MPTITKRKNGYFTAQVRIKGLDGCSQTFPDRRAAAAWATEREALLKKQRDMGGVRSDVSVLTVGSLLVEFLKDPETARLRSFDELHRLCSWWVQECGSCRVLELNVLKLRAARDKLSADRGPATTNRYLSAMRSAWNWGRSAGLVPRDHVWYERLMLTEPKGRTRFLSDDELSKVLEAAKEHSDVMHAAVVVSIATGLRQGELLRLDWADIDFTRQIMQVRVTKNDTPRAVFLPSAAIDSLTALKGNKVRSIGAVFIGDDGARLKKTGLDSRWRTVRLAAGLTDFHWHDLRHSCASFLAQQGATLMQIGSQLGHKSPSVTMRYAHLVQGAALPAHAALDAKLRS